MKYATEVTRYIDEDMNIAKVVRHLDKTPTMTRTTILRLSHLSNRRFDDVMETLVARKQVRLYHKEKGAGRAKKTTTFYEWNGDGHE